MRRVAYRNRRRKSIEVIKFDGYHLKAEDAINVTSVRARMKVLNPSILHDVKSKTLFGRGVSVSFDTLLGPVYRNVLSDMLGADTFKFIFNGTTVSKKRIDASRKTSVLYLIWYMLKHSGVEIIQAPDTISRQINKWRRLLDSSRSFHSWSIKSKIRSLQKLLRAAEMYQKLKSDEFDRMLAHVFSGLDTYLTVKSENDLFNLIYFCNSLGLKLNLPQYADVIAKKESTAFTVNSNVDVLTTMKPSDITRGKFEFFSVIPELTTNIVTSCIVNGRLSTEYSLSKYLHGKILKREYNAAHSILGLCTFSIDDALKLKPMTHTELLKANALFNTPVVSINKNECSILIRRILVTYLKRVAKQVNVKTDYFHASLFNCKYRSRFFYKCKRYIAVICSLAKRKLVATIKESTKQASIVNRVDAIFSASSFSHSILNVSTIKDISLDEVRSLVNDNTKYLPLWFFFPKEPEFRSLLATKLTHDQEEVILKLPASTLARAFSFVFKTDRDLLNKTTISTRILNDHRITSSLITAILSGNRFTLTGTPFQSFRMSIAAMARHSASLKANDIHVDMASLLTRFSRTKKVGTFIERMDTLFSDLSERFRHPVMTFNKADNTIDATKYCTNGHGVTPTITSTWNNVDTFVPSSKQFPYMVPVAFHGTSMFDALLITSFGFSLANRKNGRSLGDGIYFAPNIDKSAQYASDFIRSKTKLSGAVFMAKVFLSEKAYRGMVTCVTGKTIKRGKNTLITYAKNRFKTEEICVHEEMLPQIHVDKLLFVSNTYNNNTGARSSTSGKKSKFSIVEREDK